MHFVTGHVKEDMSGAFFRLSRRCCPEACLLRLSDEFREGLFRTQRHQRLRHNAGGHRFHDQRCGVA
jgi:hypothetical protein